MSTTNNNKQLIQDISVRIASEKLMPEEKVPKKRKYKMTPEAKVKRKNAEQLKEHQWKKGQSGNPKGRPINPLSLTALLNKKLSENPEDAEAIVNALIALGKGRDMRAIEMSFERIDGKVIERHTIEGEMPVRILFVPAQSLIGIRTEEIEGGKPLELEE